MNIFINYYYLKRLVMQGWERAINTLSVLRPRPNNTNPLNERREKENRRRQKVGEQLGQQNGINPALEICLSHIIECGVTKIIPQRYLQGNKSPAILRGSAASRRISVPMYDQSAACNLHRHIRHRNSTIKRVYQVAPDLVQHT